MERPKEVGISSEKFEWNIRCIDSENEHEIALSRNARYLAFYIRSCPSTIKVLQAGVRIMLQEIADYFGLTLEELFAIP